MKKLFLIYISLVHLCSYYVHCNTDIAIGYQFSLAIPLPYIKGFVGRAFVMEANQMLPNFRAALSVEGINEEYSCSLDVFLGEIKVWSSGHFSRFFTKDKCVLQLTQDGELELKGQNEQIGWRSGTSKQGVKVITKLLNFC